MGNTYRSFLESKRTVSPAHGQQIDTADINQILFDFQQDLVRWGVAKGRAALFADTGLGKTFMQLEWARLLNVPTLLPGLTETLPELGASSPLRIFIKVDLPQPLAPMSP